MLRSGPLIPALLASHAVPGVFAPVRLGDRDLVDGGVLDDVPVDVIRSLTTERVVAVDTSQVPERASLLHEHEGLLTKIRAVLSDEPTAFPLDMLMRAYEFRNAKLRELRYGMYPPNLKIRPKVDLRHSSFDRIDEAVEAGYKAACEALEFRTLS